MNETVMNTKSLPDVLFQLISTERVRIKETDGVIQLMPIKEPDDCTNRIAGNVCGLSRNVG